MSKDKPKLDPTCKTDLAVDCYDLIGRTVDQRMKSLIVANMEEHEQTRKKVDSILKLVQKMHEARTHNIIQDVVLIGIIIGMLLMK